MVSYNKDPSKMRSLSERKKDNIQKVVPKMGGDLANGEMVKTGCM
jgi:hypothetical protein